VSDYLTRTFLPELRLRVLQLLSQAQHRTLNDTILREAARDTGITATRSQLRETLVWLERSGCLSVEVVGDYLVATATPFGLDVAADAERVDGIKRPDRA
jgi:hypothetical protein